MIKLDHVSKKYGNFLAVDDVSFEIEDGEICGFLGANGAGKSSTIKMITGVNQITSGDIFVDGLSVIKNPLETKKSIGFVSDNVDVMLGFKGIEYLNFIANIFKMDLEVAKRRIVELATKFEIFDKLNDPISSYSHGMRQKIAVCAVLLHEPKNWILDEPMTGLDPKSAHVLKQMMIEHAKKGNTVLFSTHVLEVAENLCTKLAIINKGKIIYVGTYEELKDKLGDASLESLFLEMTND